MNANDPQFWMMISSIVIAVCFIVMAIALIAIAVIVVIVVGVVVYNSRSDAASVAFGSAMQTYQAALAQPGEPAPPGTKTFGSRAERAKAANAQFLAVADKYGLYLADKGMTARATVIVDKQGNVAYVKVQGLGEPRSDAEILAELKKLG